MAVTLRQLLDDGRVHVLDGAMGTMLYGKGFLLNVCYDELNLKQPKLVQEVHEAYVRAGAELIETNTFGANPKKLASYGLADDTEKINTAAARLARAAAGDRVSVLGAVGPLGVRIEPFGPTSREEAFTLFRRQVDGLLAGGVDGFILETFSDLDEIHAALRAVRSACDLPVITQMTIGTDGLTHYGTDPETFAKQLAEWGADVIGVNCSVGPAGVLDAVERMVKATDRPISAVPNAGLPKDVGDRKIYLASPEYMASYARRMIEAGGPPRRGGAARRALELGTEARVRRVRHQRRDRAAEGRGSDAHAGAVPRAQGGGRGGGQRSRRAARAEPHGRPAVRDPDPTGRGDRDGDPLLLPRPQPARHAVRHPRCGRRGGPEHPHHHGRPAQDGPLPGGDGGIRHRLHRVDESRVPPEPRARPREQPDRSAHPLGDRRGRESRRHRPRPRAVALRLEGGRGRRVRGHAAGVRRAAAGAVPAP